MEWERRAAHRRQPAFSLPAADSAAPGLARGAAPATGGEGSRDSSGRPLPGRPCCCPSPLFQSPRLSHMPRFPVVAVTVAELASPFACQIPPATRAAVPGVTRGTGRTWTCSVAWRDPISEAKLRLTETRRLVPSPSPCSGTFLKFLLYPCLRSSVICAPSLLLPDTPTPCQSLPGAFLSGQPPGHTSHSGEGTRWNECPSPGLSAGHLEGAWGVDPRCPWWSQPRNELPAASLSASLSPCLLTPASGAHLPNKLPAPMSSSQTLLPGGSRERPSSLPGMWSEALTSAGTEHRVFQHPIRSHAHPAPHMDRARRPAGPRTCPDGPVSEDRAGDRLRPALELSAESRLPCNVGKRWFVCGGGSDGGEQSPALRRAGPPRGSMGSHRLGRCTDSALARRS